MERLTAWLKDRLPEDLFAEFPELKADREEILIVGRIPDTKPADGEDLETARLEAIVRFREETRDARMRIAAQNERRFGRKVSWGAECGDVRRIFTNLSLPMMTRLRFDERAVLDTLVNSGVARTRSHALAWCVKLVGQNQAEWIESLRGALQEVEKVRAEGPK
jgi:hypothetical protein